MVKNFHSIKADSGLVTAELAVALPAVVAVLFVALLAISCQVQAARLQQLAALTAHAFARSESQQAVLTWLHRQDSQVTIKTHESDGVLCQTLSKRVGVVDVFDSFELSETSCVWVGQKVVNG